MAARKLKIPFSIVEDTRDQGRDAYEAALVLVRPDQYVVWAGDNAPDDVEAVLAKVTGRG